MHSSLRLFVVGILAALLGYWLSGCDGGGGSPDAGEEAPDGGAAGADAGRADVLAPVDSVGAGDPRGLGRTDAGYAYCEVPSPTGDELVKMGVTAREAALRAPHFYVVEGDVRAACEAQKVADCYDPGSSAARPCVDIQPELALVDCSDVADDFRGTSGHAWSVYVSGTCYQPDDGVHRCRAEGVAKMPRRQGQEGSFLDRGEGLCTPRGAFVGWLYR